MPPYYSPTGVGHRVECGGGHRSTGDLIGDEISPPVTSPMCVCVTCGTSGPTAVACGSGWVHLQVYPAFSVADF
jgi:hypothetical protein